jgi:hypothetical protein
MGGQGWPGVLNFVAVVDVSGGVLMSPGGERRPAGSVALGAEARVTVTVRIRGAVASVHMGPTGGGEGAGCELPDLALPADFCVFVFSEEEGTEFRLSLV